MSVTIGYLHRNRRPHEQAKAYCYASIAMMEGASMVAFSPSQVDMDTRSIHGHRYRNGDWHTWHAPLPDVVINASSPSALIHVPDYYRVEWLEQQVPFTCQPVGEKVDVLEHLRQSYWFAAYVPEMIIVQSRSELEAMLNRYGTVVMKPVKGNNGHHVMLIELKPDGWQIIIQPTGHFVETANIQRWCDHHFANGKWLIQQRISSITPQGEAFDFRVLVQKKERGEWITSIMHPKLAPPGQLVTNDLQGGSVPLMDSFLSRIQNDPIQIVQTKRRLQQLGLQVAYFLDQTRQSQGWKPLSQLGIDIGMDHDGHPWIYEVNWYPGFAPTLNWDVTMPLNHIRYAMALATRTIKPLTTDWMIR